MRTTCHSLHPHPNHQAWHLQILPQFWAAHHIDNTPPIFWFRTHHITPQTLHNYNLHHFIISHSYPILFYIIIQKKTFNWNDIYIYIFLILWSDGDTFNCNSILYNHPEDGQTTGQNMLNILWIKNIYHNIKVHLLVDYAFYKSTFLSFGLQTVHFRSFDRQHMTKDHQYWKQCSMANDGQNAMSHSGMSSRWWWPFSTLV